MIPSEKTFSFPPNARDAFICFNFSIKQNKKIHGFVYICRLSHFPLIFK